MKNIFKYLNTQKQQVIKLQKDLVSIPALSPENGGEGEYRKAKYILSYLKKYNELEIRELHAPDNRVPSKVRPNIAALLKGKDTSTTLWIVSHMDIVPPGDLSLWDTDPYMLHQKGDLLYGRGVEDNHQGIVSSILLVDALIKNSVEPNINLGLLFVSDEETGNKYGVEFLFKNHREMFKDSDVFLIPDFGSKDSSLVEISEKGVLWLKIEVTGKQCHGSTPNEGNNSLVACAAYIMRLRDLYTEFNQEDTLFSPPISTFEPTKKESNVPNINTIPGKDVFYLDCRILPVYSIDGVIEKIKKMGREIEQEYGTKINYEVIHRESSPGTDKNNPYVLKLIDAIKKEYGTNARTMGVGGGTVAVYPRKSGIPAIVWSTLLGCAHLPNEHSSIMNTIRDTKVMARLLLD